MATESETAEEFRQKWQNQRAKDVERWGKDGMTPQLWMNTLINTIIGDLRVEKQREMDKLALIKYCVSGNLQRDALSTDFDRDFNTMLAKKKKLGFVSNSFQLAARKKQHQAPTGNNSTAAGSPDPPDGDALPERSARDHASARILGAMRGRALRQTIAAEDLKELEELSKAEAEAIHVLRTTLVRAVPLLVDTYEGETIESSKEQMKFAFRFLMKVKGDMDLKRDVDSKLLPNKYKKVVKELGDPEDMAFELCLLTLMYHGEPDGRGWIPDSSWKNAAPKPLDSKSTSTSTYKPDKSWATAFKKP